MHLRLRRTAVTASVAALVLAASACSTGSTDTVKDAPEADTTADAAAFPVTVEHAFGSTEIDAEPKRVFALGYSEADFVLSLGVVPIGANAIGYGGNDNKSTDWQDKALAELGAEAPKRFDDTDGTPVDDIIKLEPDVVLATSSGLTEEDYDKLTKAGLDVVAYPDAPYATSWQESLDLVSRALGRTEEAEAVKAETEKVIADTAAKYPQLAGKSYVFGGPNSADASSFYVYTLTDNRPRLLTELGMEAAPVIEKYSKPGEFLFNVSSERAGEMKSDVFLTYATSDDEVQQLGSNPLLQQIPAIASNNWYATVDETEALGMSAPSPLSIPSAMESYIPHVAAAVDGKGSTS